ncbi:hypothetical protein PMAYCL1PPCAC_20258, partial [Pristionchus mayeri]
INASLWHSENMPRNNCKPRNLLLAFILFIIILSVSISLPSSEDESEGPSRKRQKSSCYFSENRYSDEERRFKTSRVRSTAVSTKCRGNPIKFSAINDGKDMKLYGSFSKMDLMINRGNASYVRSKADEAEFKDFEVCPQHVNELLIKWREVTYKHIRRDKKDRSKILCSWPWQLDDHKLHIHGKKIHNVEREEARFYLMATGNHI